MQRFQLVSLQHALSPIAFFIETNHSLDEVRKLSSCARPYTITDHEEFVV